MGVNVSSVLLRITVRWFGFVLWFVRWVWVVYLDLMSGLFWVVFRICLWGLCWLICAFLFDWDKGCYELFCVLLCIGDVAGVTCL